MQNILGWDLLLPIGCVNMRGKNCVLLPAAGWRTQLFHLIFTQPMGSNKSQPSTMFPISSSRGEKRCAWVLDLLRSAIHCIAPNGGDLRTVPSPRFIPRDPRLLPCRSAIFAEMSNEILMTAAAPSAARARYPLRRLLHYSFIHIFPTLMSVRFGLSLFCGYLLKLR